MADYHDDMYEYEGDGDGWGDEHAGDREHEHGGRGACEEEADGYNAGGGEMGGYGGGGGGARGARGGRGGAGGRGRAGGCARGARGGGAGPDAQTDLLRDGPQTASLCYSRGDAGPHVRRVLQTVPSRCPGNRVVPVRGTLRHVSNASVAVPRRVSHPS
jgi:hypothetical protein